MAARSKFAIDFNKNGATENLKHVDNPDRRQTFGMNGIGAPSPVKKIVIRSINSDEDDVDDGDIPTKTTFTSTPSYMHNQPQDTSYIVNTPGHDKTLQPQDMSYMEVMGNKAPHLFQSHVSSTPIHTPIQTQSTHQQWECEHGCGFKGKYDLVVWHERICINTTRDANDPRSPYSPQLQTPPTWSTSSSALSPNPPSTVASMQPSTPSRSHRASHSSSSIVDNTAMQVNSMDDIALNEHLAKQRGLYPGETYLSNLATDSPATWANAPLEINKLAMCQLVRDTKEQGSKRAPVYMLRLQGAWDVESQSFKGNGQVLFYAKRCVDRKQVSSYLIATSYEELVVYKNRHMAKLKGNFLSDNFTLYDDGCKPRQTDEGMRPRYELANIKFLSRKLLFSGPRQLLATIPALDPITNKPTTDLQTLINKTPEWNSVNKTYSLRFFGRSRLPSVKNFALIRDGSRYVHSPSTLRLGKMTEDTFTVDFRFPLTPLQAFGIALSSFDTSMRESVNLL